MSRRDWETGEFKLPTSDFARIRKAVEDAQKKVLQERLALTQEFWKSLTAKQKRDQAAYLAAVQEWSRKQWAGVESRFNSDPARREQIFTTEWLLHSFARPTPRRALQSDIEMPTNRTTEFSGGEYTITFDRTRSTVRFSIDEGNHAVENAHGQPAMKALMSGLSSTRWTRGTGGHAWGSDEYAVEGSQNHGGDSVYTTLGHGPIGAVEAPDRTGPWKDPQGQSFYVERTWGRGGYQGRVKRGVPAGGQFASHTRPDAGISLRW